MSNRYHPGASRETLTLEMHRPTSKPVFHRYVGEAGFTVEHVELEHIDGYDYKLSGGSHYIALHDIVFTDCEAIVDGAQPNRTCDLRDTLTYIPKGCSIAGWGMPVNRTNSFTALYFNPQHIKEDAELKNFRGLEKAQLYFYNPALVATLQKIRTLLSSDSYSPFHVESLCAVAAYELMQIEEVGDAGLLTPKATKRITEFLSDNLSGELSLQRLADEIGLSKFHFLRLFKATFHKTPHQYLLQMRVDKAAGDLRLGEIDLDKIARDAGFPSVDHFRRVFKDFTGATPRQFLRGVRDRE